MPIDIKWVRQNPNQVDEWQRIRSRCCLTKQNRHDDGTTTTTTTTTVLLDKDELCRKYMYQIQQYKKRIKHIQQQLRPSLINSSDDKNETNENISSQQQQQQQQQQQPRRETLLQDKKELEDQIQHVEILLATATRETQQALWKLGSPIIENSQEQQQQKYDSSVDVLEEVGSSALLSSLLEGNNHVSQSGLGMAIQQSWKQHTMEYFASTYPSVELPRGIGVVQDVLATTSTTSTNNLYSTFIDPDFAHAIWGCVDVDSSLEDNTPMNCPFCNISSQQQQQQPKIEVMLPTWIRLLKQHIPNKSIWGDKQLPVFTSIWSNNSDSTEDETNTKIWLTPRNNKNQNHTALSLQSQFSLELVALTASSTVDAREIQNDMLHELKEYYSNLLVVDDTSSSSMSSDRIVIHHVDPPDLNIHEWNRIEIHAKTMSSGYQTVCLGWVSSWGDAASRAFEMAFAGGGVRTTGKQAKKSSSQVSKEYVYVVQASVVDPSTWEKIIFLNSKKSDSQTMMGIPPRIKPPPCLTDLTTKTINIEEVYWIPVQDLTINSGKKNSKNTGSVFGPKRETPRSGRGGDDNVDTPKFPPIWRLEKTSTGIENEFLSCPFEFLF